MPRNTFPVIEIFGPTIQGEGRLIGALSHFVRFGGCTYRCSWCDSMHAVDPVQIKANATWMGAGEITDKVRKLGTADKSARWVTLSGGDPLMWELGDLSVLLQEEGFKVAVETQGAFWKDWLIMADLITVSPKPPSSGMADNTDHDILSHYADSRMQTFKQVIFKVVIKDSTDFGWACNLKNLYPSVPFYLSQFTDPTSSDTTHNEIALDILRRYSKLVDMVLTSNQSGDFIVLPQLHAMLWGHSKGK